MTGNPAPTGLTAGQVCRELGLIPSTLRAWNRRYGIGPSEHESGKHRYYNRADVAALARMQSLIAAGTPTAVAAGIVTRGLRTTETRLPRTARGLRSAVLRMDGATVSAALRDGMQREGPMHVWHRLYRPVMTEIGQEVAEGGRCLEAERLLSWAASAALHLVPQPAGHPRVILACAEGEQHTIGLEVLRAVLAEQDVPTIMLGADTPKPGLRAAVGATDRAIVVLAAQTSRTAHTGRILIPGTDVRVLAAGPGWTDVRLPDGDTRVSTVESALEQIHRELGA